MDSFDPVSAATHLGMAAWAAFAGLFLLRLTRGHGPLRRWSVGLYGVSVVLLYAASGTFHGLVAAHAADAPRAAVVGRFWVAQRLDKTAVFLLILGSNLPIMAYLLRGRWRWVCLAGISLSAAAGIAAMWLWPGLPHEYLVGVYVGMGVFGLVPFRQYLRRVGWAGMGWVLAFAAVYMAGGAADAAQWPVLLPGYFGPHEVLHVCDMVATLIHYGVLVRYVVVPAGLVVRRRGAGPVARALAPA